MSHERGAPMCAGQLPQLKEPQAEEHAEWFKALADPTRIRILNLLASNDDAVCVCDIVGHFAIGQPTQVRRRVLSLRRSES